MALNLIVVTCSPVVVAQAGGARFVHSLPVGQSASEEHGKPSLEPPRQYKSLHIPLGQATSGSWHGGTRQQAKPLLEPPRHVRLHVGDWNAKYRALPSFAGTKSGPPVHGSFRPSPLLMQSLIHPEKPHGYWFAGQIRQESARTQGSAGFGLPEVGVCNCRKVLFHENKASILETSRLVPGHSAVGVLHPLATARSSSTTVEPAGTVVGPDASHWRLTHRYAGSVAGGLSTQNPLLHLETAVQGSKSSQPTPWLIELP